MSEEEKTPTTGLADDAGKNGMGGVSEPTQSDTGEPPKRKRGRPPKKPGDPPGKYSKKTPAQRDAAVEAERKRQIKSSSEARTIGEYVAQHPTVMEESFTNTQGQIRSYDSSLTVDEVIARDLDRHMEIMALPRVNTNSLEELQGRYTDYMMICRKYGKRMTVAGFAEAIGVNRQTLWRWCSGGIPKPPEIVDFLNAVISAVNAELEDLMVTNRINPVSGIFLLKQAGYRDNVDLTVTNSATTGKTEEELAAEYLNSIPTVDD